MAKELSVAPKERVNIVYRPATGDAQEEKEIPLKLLIMGDFTMRPDDRPVEDREPINVDKDNFNEILKAQNLGLNVMVPNRISGEPDEEMNVSLKFESLKDFEPEAVARNTPELNKLLALRQALASLKSPLSNIPQFRKKIQELVTDETRREQLMKELGIEE
jgi:type VI secretion system protein ImpB